MFVQDIVWLEICIVCYAYDSGMSSSGTPKAACPYRVGMLLWATKLLVCLGILTLSQWCLC